MAPFPSLPSPLLQLEHIRLERGRHCLINDLSLQLLPGGALILTGPNGSGKSSLLRLIAGLCPPASGTFTRHTELAWLGPENALKPALTVEQNLRLFAPHDTAAIFQALKQVDLPHLLDCPTRLLSLGQKRRIALARLILAQAPLWLLDEPTNALDSTSLSLLESLLATHRAQGGGIIIASHTPLSLPDSQTLPLTSQPPIERHRPEQAAGPAFPQGVVSDSETARRDGRARGDTHQPDQPAGTTTPNKPQALPSRRMSSATARQPEGMAGPVATRTSPTGQQNHCTESCLSVPAGYRERKRDTPEGTERQGTPRPHPFLLHLRRELHLACQHGTESLAGLLFLTLCSTLFPLALGPSPHLLQRAGPGILWVCTLLACLLPLERLYNADAEDGALDMLHITLHPGLIALGKIIIHWLTASLPILLATPLLALFYQLPMSALPVLLFSLTLGSLTLALIGGMAAAITMGARRNTLLLPLLSLPLMTPSLIFGTLACTATGETSLHANLSLQGAVLLLALPFCPLIAGASLKDAQR